jgi:hypothetical protein
VLGHLECIGGRVPCSLVEFSCCGHINQVVGHISPYL